MDLPIEHHPGFVLEPFASADFRRLWDELDWRRVTRRREYWTNNFNRPYSYGKPEYARVYEPQPTHEIIESYRKALYFITKTNFEGCFLNGYESAQDALSWHADDDPGIDHTKPIAIVTLYDGPVNTSKMVVHKNQKEPMPRTIEFMEQPDRDATREEIKALQKARRSVEMGQGSLILMKPGMQFTHFHQIPKVGFVPRPRISLTFRGLLA